MNRNGERFSPCLIPLQQAKKKESPSLFFIRDFILAYIFFIKSDIFHLYHNNQVYSRDHLSIQYQRLV